MTRWIVAIAALTVAVAGTVLATRRVDDTPVASTAPAGAATGAPSDRLPAAGPVAVVDEVADSIEDLHTVWSDEAMGEERASAVARSTSASDGFVPLAPLVDEPVRAFDAPAATIAANVDYRALLLTTAGIVEVELFEGDAPATVDNFVFLALQRFYDGVPFHRVLDGFMAQTGDPTGTGRGGPGYRFDDEFGEGLAHDRGGLLSMANAGPNTNGSQFFLTFVPTPWLDGRHAIFGEVVAGTDTLDLLTRIDPSAPSFVARVDRPLSDLVAQGALVDDDTDTSVTVATWLTSLLGSVPEVGANFVVAGNNGVVGTIDGALAIGLFPSPDRLNAVIVMAKPTEDLEEAQ